MKPTSTPPTSSRRPVLRIGAMGAVGAFAVAALAVLAPTAAQADPLSPQTGARVSTTGEPTAGAGGQVYYVDASGGDDAAAGTSAATAWKTLAKVDASDFAPGDVIAFERGETFTGSATISSAGTSAAPITITAYGTGAQPVLTNPGEWNMLVLDAPDLVVEDLAFTDGVVFDNADGQGIRGPKYELSGAVALTSNAADAELRDNVFTQVGVGIKTYGENTLIEHNTFQSLKIAFRGFDSGSETSYGAIGISIDNSGAHVTRNDFIDCRSTDSPYGADGGALEIEGFAHDKNDITIDHNYSRGSQGFLEVTETNSSDVTLSYNVSDDYQQFIAWDTTTHPNAYLAVNNTVVRQNDNSRLIDQYYYREAGPEPTDDWITLRNNVFVADAWLTFHDFPRDHNLYSPGVGLDVPLGPGDLVADPQFADEAGHDLALTALSPAIDSGVASTSTDDLLGNPTTVGAGTDLGALEFQSASSLSGSSVIADGGFESQTTLDATTTPWSTTGGVYAGLDIAAGKAHSGADDAWLSGKGTLSGGIVQTVAVQPATLYRLTVWMRNAAAVDDVTIGAFTSAGVPLAQERVGHAADYSAFSVSFDSGSETSVRVSIALRSPNGGGWVQLDDVSLQPVTFDAAVTPPVDPGAGAGAGAGDGAGTGTGGAAAGGSTAGAGAAVAVAAVTGGLAATGVPIAVFLSAGALLLGAGAVLALRARSRRVPTA